MKVNIVQIGVLFAITTLLAACSPVSQPHPSTAAPNQSPSSTLQPLATDIAPVSTALASLAPAATSTQPVTTASATPTTRLQPSSTPAVTATATPASPSVSEKPVLTNYQSAHNALNWPRRHLKLGSEGGFRPLDLDGEYEVSIGYDNEVYLTNWVTGKRTRITHDGHATLAAVLSDQYIAWFADPAQATPGAAENQSSVPLYDIVIYDRHTGAQRRITSVTGATQLAMDGNRLVWADMRNEVKDLNDDLYAYDLATDTEYPIAVAPGSQQNPSIQGDLIVWQDDRSNLKSIEQRGCGNCPDNRFDIYLYDFKTHTSRALVEDAWLKANPSVYGQRVVWESYQTGYQADIFLLDLATGRIRRLTQTLAHERHPILSGDHVLWTATLDCDAGSGDPEPETGVFVLDLNTQVVQKLSDFREPFPLFDQDTALILEGCMMLSDAYTVKVK